MRLDLSGRHRNRSIPDSYLLIPRAWSPLASSMVFTFGPPGRPREVNYLFTLNRTMCVGDFELPVVDLHWEFAAYTGDKLPRLAWCRDLARSGAATLRNAAPFNWSYAATPIDPEATHV